LQVIGQGTVLGADDDFQNGLPDTHGLGQIVHGGKQARPRVQPRRLPVLESCGRRGGAAR
jgi:hypothetical protein